MMAANQVGDVKESATHQPLLAPDERLVVAAVQFGHMCPFGSELPDKAVLPE